MTVSNPLPHGWPRWALLATMVALATGCPGPTEPPPDGGQVDAGTPDAGTGDAGTPDAGAVDGGLPSEAPPLPENTARIHFFRQDADYAGWGLHLWGDQLNLPREVTWATPWPPTGLYAHGCGPWAYFDIPIKPGATDINFILHKGDTKSVPEDMAWNFAASGKEIFQVLGESTMHTSRPAVSCKDFGSLATARAHWVDPGTIVWPMTGTSTLLAGQKFRLYHSPTAGLSVDSEAGTVSGGTAVDLTFTGTKWTPADNGGRFPHLKGDWVLTVPEAVRSSAADILRGQVAVARFDAQDNLVTHTSLQIPGVLDTLYASAAKDAKLGLSWADGRPVFRLWAPTAKSVALLVYEDATVTESTRHTMMRDDASGIWSYTGEASDDRKYYQYEVVVYTRSTRNMETNTVTDPYSLSLSKDSARSFIVNLDDANLEPAGWGSLVKPQLVAPEDISIYELHVRDFSIRDSTVPAEHRGKFMAFTHPSSAGMTHLKGLAQAGLSHLHLLPPFDIATVPEDAADRTEPDWDAMVAAAAEDPASEVPQQLVAAHKDTDGFNWGYDPYHFNAPEGSYSTNPADGAVRVLEFRQMVQGLNGIGLRVVMDVVYNHTAASGQSSKSVLDRVVPGYYHRLTETGQVANSTCCENTATEHAMMRKLMGDTLVNWATQYKVEAFRFDLMGHHMKADMEEVKQRLGALTQASDGVDGSKIYLYGEGWNFGEVENNRRGFNATQLNMKGTGIGTFNDRIRDAVRGGGPFDSGGALRSNQGFINGLFYDPNDVGLTGATARSELLKLADIIRVGMAGNLAEYSLVNYNGLKVYGFDVKYNGQPAGYTDDPQEVINYVSKHDNQTLFDINAYKLPLATSMSDRVRAQNLGVSITVLGQGIPFLHAGVDTLRSKSLDRDSYNSGDWFNRLDWTYSDNNWAVGLPVAEKNQDNWEVMRPLLTGISRPAQADILRARDHLREVLAVRMSSRLFRLTTKQQVMERVRFHNTGSAQTPGLIVMSIVDGAGADDLDPNAQTVVVLINATREAVTFTDAAFTTAVLTLHPALTAGTDTVVKQSTFDPTAGSFTIPARTTAVFWGHSGLTLNRQ
jgi:pullulanase